MTAVRSGPVDAVTSHDTARWLGLAGVSLLVSWLPARLAAKMDPSIALRAE